MEAPKKYDPKVEEVKILDLWKEKQVYTFKKSSVKKIYAIDTPPPTVSGKMHIGHSFSYSHEDFIARYKRLRGFNVFYPFGTDDNGLPTERLVEKMKNVRSTKMDRGDFRKLCYDTIVEIKPDFVNDWVRLGMSCDFTKAYSTIDLNCQRISQAGFIALYKKGLIYSQKEPMSWCPHCQTAIAQAEFESKDLTSAFNDIIFKSESGDDLIIATTRPEFIPACVALFANPDDNRYSHLKGKFAIVPLFNYKIPIVFDAAVDKEKGTGLMMVCTFGDKEDIDKWKRYKLETRIVVAPDGKMSDAAGKYAGLKLVDARKAITDDLQAAGNLVGQKPITHAVNVHERCGTELEFLITRQWFIRVLDKKQELLAQVEKIQWRPEYMKKRMINWIENLNWDWCISRQRHFGIPFPVWRNKKTGEIILADPHKLPVDPIKDLPAGYSADQVDPELDIMDTWATSGLTPIIALNAYGLTNDAGTMLPIDLRPQAHDIIRTWAFYTIVRSFYEFGKIPWENIVLSGYVLAKPGEKMSKSKGNIVSPGDVLKKFSADALRFWAAGSSLGDDLPYKEQDLVAGERFVTKIWNSYKFLSLFIDSSFDPSKKPELTVIDQWVLGRLDEVIEKNTEDFDNYEFGKVKYRTEQFFWNVFCDNYLELVKDRLYKPEVYGADGKVSGLYTAYHVLKKISIMMSSFTPFVTESIWQYFFKQYEKIETIVDASWPSASKVSFKEAIASGDLAMLITSEIRKFKAASGKPLNAEILKIEIPSNIEKEVESVKSDILGTVKAKEIVFGEVAIANVVIPMDKEELKLNVLF